MKAVSWSYAASGSYAYWLDKNWYYHAYYAAVYRFLVPAGMRVLQVQCKTGYLLNALLPRYGVGVDLDSTSIALAQKKYPQHHFFCQSISELSTQSFDYIILSTATMEVDDIQDLFENLRRFCHPKTRIIIDYYSALWEPLLWCAQLLGLRRPTEFKNWLSRKDLANFLNLTGFEIITQRSHLLLPLYIPFVSAFVNGFLAQLPLINMLTLNSWLIARPTAEQKHQKEYTVSVIVPCRNERGNISAAVERCPNMGSDTEIIFIEGGSSDGTFEEIERVSSLYKNDSEKKITYYKQTGSGKGDAVRLGFEKASGDILIILDADLTVPPEELPKFYRALATGKGDFINGSRLVYGMEHEAMRFLNLCANYLFGLGFSWLLGQPIKDTLCGTKALFKNDYEKIAQQRSFFGKIDPFGDFDLLFGAAKQNLKIIEMPVHYKNRTYGSTQIARFKHGLLLLRMSFLAAMRFKWINSTRKGL